MCVWRFFGVFATFYLWFSIHVAARLAELLVGNMGEWVVFVIVLD